MLSKRISRTFIKVTTASKKILKVVLEIRICVSVPISFLLCVLTKFHVCLIQCRVLHCIKWWNI